jgi:hypothetical protein
MHPKKARFLADMEELAREYDTLFGEMRDVLSNPREHGLRVVGATAFTLPAVGLTAVMSDLAHVMVARTEDWIWDTPPQPPPSVRG